MSGGWRRGAWIALGLLLALGPQGCGEVALSPRCRSDDDCPKDHLCNFIVATCYPASRRDIPTLTSQVQGSFSCPFFDQVQSEISNVGKPAALGEFKGATFSFQIGCGVWANKSDYELVLMASTLEPNLLARFNVLIRGSDFKPGTLLGPTQVWGWLTTLKSGQPELTRAMAWGGKATLTKVPTKAGEVLEGTLDLKLVPTKNKNFGGICRLKQLCDKTSCDALSSLALGSPDCRVGHYCFPAQDGTNSGVCISRCKTLTDCTSHDPKSTCYTTSGGVSLCLHTCASDTDCETPSKCVPGLGCLF